MVGNVGLEPTRVAPLGFEPSAFTISPIPHISHLGVAHRPSSLTGNVFPSPFLWSKPCEKKLINWLFVICGQSTLYESAFIHSIFYLIISAKILSGRILYWARKTHYLRTTVIINNKLLYLWYSPQLLVHQYLSYRAFVIIIYLRRQSSSCDLI